jgi:hypothetical protein
MLRVIALTSPILCDAFVRILSLEEKDKTPIATVYQRGSTIALLLRIPLSHDAIAWIVEAFLPDRLYVPHIGYALDVVHEVWDVIVPHTIMTYDPVLEKSEITEENRDTFMGSTRFLTLFDEQKDYYVEDYGLTVGGIIVDSAPEDPSDDLSTKMALAYEADTYTRDILSPLADIVDRGEVLTIILVGITQGKSHPKYWDKNPYDLIVKNMMTTMSLMEDEWK